ncbi:uncharacterized protein LOC143470558 isoform X2 [Clavelina lepadiformis]|uniref:C3H1-type domain-containing protein n=1 Tax=Clavelina lepadiformis TaxID=159417 RepID=A0ABP0FK73_CLALP
MNKNKSLQHEIDYWKELITLHKQSGANQHGTKRYTANHGKVNGTFSGHYTWTKKNHDKKFIKSSKVNTKIPSTKASCPQNRNFIAHTHSRVPPQTSGKVRLTNAKSFSPPLDDMKANKYKWKNGHSSSMLSNDAYKPPAKLTKLVDMPESGKKIIATKHKLVKVAGYSSPTKKLKLNQNVVGNSVNVINKASPFCWTKDNLKLNLPQKLHPKHSISSGKIKAKTGSLTTSTRQAHAEIHQHSPGSFPRSTAGKQILNKYRLQRTHHRRASKVNVSKNPYKVIKKSPKSLTNKTSYHLKLRQNGYEHNATFHHKQHPSIRGASKKKLLLPRHSAGALIKNSRYKLVRAGTQTRSPKTGNIVLRRKISRVKSQSSKPLLHFPTVKQRLASQVLHKSLETIRSKNKHTKKKTYCLFYNRFGKCNRGGKCPYTHDPERVAICTRFLRGTCRDTCCLFSHKLSKKKVPVCSFYLRGRCSTKDCPYLHVFVGHNAPVCKAFATAGYCTKADNCKEQHIRVCWSFYQNGHCDRGEKCNLPHSRKTNKKKKNTRIPGKPVLQSQSLQCSLRSMESETAFNDTTGFISLPKQKSDALPLTGEISTKAEITDSLGKQAVEVKMRIQPRLKIKIHSSQ